MRIAKMVMMSSSLSRHIMRLQLLAFDAILLLLDIFFGDLRLVALSSRLFLNCWNKLALEQGLM
jgi:hypothetical protein